MNYLNLIYYYNCYRRPPGLEIGTRHFCTKRDQIIIIRALSAAILEPLYVSLEQGYLNGRDRVIQIWSGRQPDYDLLFWWPIFYLIGKNSVINKEDRLDVLGSSRFDPIGPELIQLEELRSSRIDPIGHPISSNLTQNPTSSQKREPRTSLHLNRQTGDSQYNKDVNWHTNHRSL